MLFPYGNELEFLFDKRGVVIIMKENPRYWRTTLDEIDQVIQGAKKGKKELLCVSAGGRSIYSVFYGRENDLKRTANLSSALGARDPKYYADKSAPDYRPTLLLVGCIHGGEFEGTMALLNLISVMECGEDLAGEDYSRLLPMLESVNLLLIPCANPDGRSHIPFDSFVGKSFEELRYYNQGTWLDGSLCNWPDCKKIHPIKDKVSYLGGYFNDDGVNMMHDNFFGDKATETDALLRVTERFAPDFSVLLHGGTNSTNAIIPTYYAPAYIWQEIEGVVNRLKSACEAVGLPFASAWAPPSDRAVSFNLPCAMYHLCGTPCVTYECNQGLIPYNEHTKALTQDEIYKEHWLLIEVLCEHIINKPPFCRSNS